MVLVVHVVWLVLISLSGGDASGLSGTNSMGSPNGLSGLGRLGGPRSLNGLSVLKLEWSKMSARSKWSE